jgi:hypothetical protein
VEGEAIRPLLFGVINMRTIHQPNIFNGNTLTVTDPQTKQDWSELLAYLYYMYRQAKLPVTYYPTVYARGALRLDGIIGCKQIGRTV